MDRSQSLEIEQMCVRVLNRYAVAVGDWDFDAFVECFAEDGIWERPGSPTMVGRAAMRDYMVANRPPDTVCRHVNGTAQINVIDDNNATGISYTTVYNFENHKGGIAPMKGPDYVVEYRDRFKKVGEDWLIARRNTSLIFRADYAFDLPGVPNPLIESGSAERPAKS